MFFSWFITTDLFTHSELLEVPSLCKICTVAIRFIAFFCIHPYYGNTGNTKTVLSDHNEKLPENLCVYTVRVLSLCVFWWRRKMQNISNVLQICFCWGWEKWGVMHFQSRYECFLLSFIPCFPFFSSFLYQGMYFVLHFWHQREWKISYSKNTSLIMNSQCTVLFSQLTFELSLLPWADEKMILQTFLLS